MRHSYGDEFGLYELVNVFQSKAAVSNGFYLSIGRMYPYGQPRNR